MIQLLLLALVAFPLLLLDRLHAASEKPNVLFILADDISYETIGAFKILDIDTPNLDKLMERGATFSHAYNMGAWGGAVCQASRAMLNTGHFLWAAHKTDFKAESRNGKLWSQRMKSAGYNTFMTGKWHVPLSAASVFDTVEHIRAGMPDQTPQGYNRPKDEEDYAAGWKPWDTRSGGFWEGGKHWSEVVADDALGFLAASSASENPFFMYVAFSAAHDPRQAPKDFIDRYPLSRIKLPKNFLPEYPDAEAICGRELRDERLLPYPRTEYAVKVNRQEYFALITHMDHQIGRIMKALEESGKAENTYVIFTADHGLAVGHHGLVGKQNEYDHSVRVPFMVVGPGVKPGTTIDTPIYLQDVMPTTLEIADAASTKDVDFKSLLPLLHHETTDHYDSIYGAYMKTQRMITTNDGWKLIVYPTINKQKIFNLTKDPDEMNNLSSSPESAGKLDELSARLEMKMKEFGDPLPSLTKKR